MAPLGVADRLRRLVALIPLHAAAIFPRQLVLLSMRSAAELQPLSSAASEAPLAARPTRCASSDRIASRGCWTSCAAPLSGQPDLHDAVANRGHLSLIRAEPLIAAAVATTPRDRPPASLSAAPLARLLRIATGPTSPHRFSALSPHTVHAVSRALCCCCRTP